MYRNHGTLTSALFSKILVLMSLVSANLLQDAPHTPEFQGYQSSGKFERLPGKLEYKLSEGGFRDDSREGALFSYITSLLFRSRLIDNIISYFGKPKLANERLIHDTAVQASNSEDRTLQKNERTKFEASLSFDAPPRGTERHIKDEEWANTLFGPTGVLTTIFHIMDDRRKDSIPKHKARVSSDTNPNHDAENNYSVVHDNLHSDFSSLPEFFSNAKPVDLAKFFEAFLTNSQGDFEDPVAELPEFLGICNRLSCGDIYKAIDQFRKSEFFTNFQTALQLIQDPKGWEILGDLLSNPELISQFTGGNGLEKLFGSTLTGQKQIRKPLSKEIGPEDGNLGTDFSSMVNERKIEKHKKPTEFELPEIAENVDSIDYYSAVENGEDEDQNGGAETITKPEETVRLPTGKEATIENENISFPEISESIDESIETATKSDTASFMTLPKPPNQTTPKTLRTTTSKIPTTKRSWSSTPVPIHVMPSSKAQQRTTPIIATTKNFRRDNDYYAMYYDD